MPAVRARLDAVLDRVRADLQAEAGAAAAPNKLLSKSEAEDLASGLLRAADEEVRMRQGPGARVTVDEATDAALEAVRRNIAAINQTTGAGAGVVSQDEIRRLQGVHAETAARAARAYELLTGKSVVLDGRVPASPAPAGLPDGARAALVAVLQEQLLLAPGARVDMKGVRATDGGFVLQVASHVFSGEVFVKEIDGRFLVAPKPFDDATYALVKAEARRFFDSDFAPDMQQWGATRAEIAAARAACVPSRALLVGESDPNDLVSSYPLVFQIDNQSGSDHGIYAGVNPASGDVEVYAFN